MLIINLNHLLGHSWVMHHIPHWLCWYKICTNWHHCFSIGNLYGFNWYQYGVVIINVSCYFVGFTNHRHFSIQIVKVRIVMGKLIIGHKGLCNYNQSFYFLMNWFSIWQIPIFHWIIVWPIFDNMFICTTNFNCELFNVIIPNQIRCNYCTDQSLIWICNTLIQFFAVNIDYNLQQYFFMDIFYPYQLVLLVQFIILCFLLIYRLSINTPLKKLIFGIIVKSWNSFVLHLNHLFNIYILTI